MGGEISVRSTPGEGSCFRVRLMLSPVLRPADRPDAAKQAISGYRGARRTVLVVDDDPDHIAFVRTALSPLGFAIGSAASGEACLADVARQKPDLVLLDISLPGIDGWETARRLREDVAKDIPIIMISADPRLESQRLLSAAHHDAYLMKPVRLSAMLDAIARALNLEWVQARGEAAREGADGGYNDSLSLAHLQALIHLGEIGHVRGILAKLDEIGASHPPAQPFLARLRRLAEECDLETYRATLEPLVRHDVRT
jgi:CheY-like chemotaxis protein